MVGSPGPESEWTSSGSDAQPPACKLEERKASQEEYNQLSFVAWLPDRTKSAAACTQATNRQSSDQSWDPLPKDRAFCDKSWSRLLPCLIFLWNFCADEVSYRFHASSRRARIGRLRLTDLEEPFRRTHYSWSTFWCRLVTLIRRFAWFALVIL